MFLGSPIVLIQLWKFVAPGLYKNEKKALLPYLIATPILFLLGGMLIYYLVMPLAIKFSCLLKPQDKLIRYPFNLKLK